MNSSVLKRILVFFLTLMGTIAFAQEPTNHPTVFAAATQSSTSIQLTWTGSTGANLPSHYLILLRIVPGGVFSVPADGAAVADDPVLADNLGAHNVGHSVGANSYTWLGLPIDTDFEFIIYPYKTGGAPTPDFKIDAGGGLTATASTKRPTVTSPTVSGIGDVAATLGGTVTSNGGNTLTERGTLWKTTAGVTIGDNKLAEGGTAVAAFTSARTGLNSGVQIFYAAYATNIAGSSLSGESSFFTFSTVPNNHPASVTATAVSGTQINLTFTSIAANGPNTVGYIILRNVGSDPLTSSVQDGVAPGSLALGSSTLVATITSTSATTYNDTGLAPETDYHYAVVPFNWNTTNPETYNYKVGAGFTIASDITFSNLSDIIFTNSGTSASINYKARQATSIDNSDLGLSHRLANFQIRDGGPVNDADSEPTIINSITIQVGNPANVRRIALFVIGADTEIAGTEQTMPGSGTVVFTPSSPIVVADNTNLDFMVRCTFQATVTDNQSIHLTVTSVTGSSGSSSFTDPDGGGATTGLVINQIDVDATKLRFITNPPATAINTDFSLTVRAIDSNPYNNLDLDYTGKIDLAIFGGAGTLSGGAQSLSPSLVAGQFTWTQLEISAAGSYTITGSDDDYTDAPESQDDIDDATGSITISSASAGITQPAPLNLCFGSTPQPLGNIVITETDASGFSSGGTFSLALPSGFVFDQTVTTAPVVGGGSDISGATALSYPGSNIVEFSYSITGTSNINSITIAGLRISSPHPGTASPSAIGGSITRSGGTANIAGDISGTVHGTVNAALGTPPGGLGFTVAKVNVSDVDVDPNETRFSQGANAVRLVGTPSTGVFVGSGVTFVSGEYRFNPSSLSPGNYVITYTVQNGAQSCDFVVQKTFEVYVTNITGLALQYCNNSATSPTLSVSPAYITGRYGAGYTFQKFVYWNTPTFTPIDITVPSATEFDPKQAVYQPVYASTASVYGTSGIWIGFTVTNGLFTYTEWQLIQVNPATKPSFTIPKLNFCEDELPVTLTGVPANTNTIGDDFFTATVGQTASVTNGGNPVVWSFNPGDVTGVLVGTPASLNITYTYRDPATGCSGVSDPQTITVSSRPSTVAAAAITSGISQSICQGTAVAPFTAIATNYRWYTDSPPTNQLGTGNTFTPTVNTLVAATTNFYVTQVVNGCESNKQPSSPTPPLQLSVVVNPTPVQPVPDFTEDYCAGQTVAPVDLQITSGANIKWYKNGVLVLNNVSSPNATQIANNLLIDNMVPAVHTFDVTQTASGCEGLIDPTKVTVTIKSLPSLSLTADADTAAICKTNPTLTFSAFDNSSGSSLPAKSPEGVGSWSGVSAIVPNSLNGTAQLNPSLLSPGKYTLQFTYTNSTSLCSNSTNAKLTILPTITPLLSPLDSCEKLFVRINNQSTIEYGSLTSSTATIVQTQWSFGDGSGTSPGDGPINDGRTIGTYFSPEHLFSGTGSFPIQYTMKTSDGCTVSASRQLIIRPKPNVNFSWRNVCRSTVSSTEFIASTNPVLPIANYNWNFTVNGTLTHSSAGTGSNPTVAYDIDGKDSVQLIVTTNSQCKDTTQLPIYIVPSFPTLTENNSYDQNFNVGADSWITGGVNSSWAHGQPSGTVVDADASPGGLGSAWDTNLSGVSNTQEQSWVLSQCFDFSMTQKPIISLDIWSDTPSGNDGAVLQYNESGNILNDADWITIGTPGQGANWYDESGISSSPGNQTANDVGWTGVYGGWKRAAFKLDNLIGKSNIVFRIAFASNSPRREGFAFDNVFIGERSRTLLLENFTNSSSAADSKSHNDIFGAFANSNEIARIQFHTAFPGPDPLNEANAEINNSRTAFYGITNPPVYAVDGTVVKGNLELLKLYDDRLLTPSALRIDINATKDGDLVRINTTLTNTTNQMISTDGLNVFTTIVEKSVTEDAFLGQNDDLEFHFVAREMLPSAAGLKITQDITPLGNVVMPEVVWKNRDLIDVNSGNASIVVFVQSIEGGNKNVLQAKMIDAAAEPDAVTGTELGAIGQFTAYPNPSQGVLNIRLPHAPIKLTPMAIVDGFGREVYSNNFKVGEKEKTITTSEFASGVYIIQIKSPSGEIIRKKVIIAN